MVKKTRARPTAKEGSSEDGINPRRPCPCGSGKRFKSCHGLGDDVIVTRPFAGLAAEPDLVALREFVPSALVPLPLASPEDGAVTLASVLPGAAAALVRADGERLVGMQVQTRSGDLSADLGRAVRWVQSAEPGDVLPVSGPAAAEPVRLQDLLDPDAVLEPTLHTDFSWWLAGTDAAPAADATAALERANSVIMPTEQLVADGVRGAYWVDAKEKAHLRWVRSEPEERLLDALSRLSVAGELDLGDGSRYAGSFRAHGLLVPVWDLDPERHAKEWTGAAASFAGRIERALASLNDGPLDAAERRARSGLAGRQVTLR